MSITKSVASQIAKLELPINEYAMGRTYLIGKGSSRLAIQFNHISFDRPPREFTKSHKPINVSSKLWSKRYELFSLFDKGIEIAKDAWSMGVPEIFAEHMASRFNCCKIIDAYCGAGSLTVQLAKYNQVAALDASNDNIASAHHNVTVYEVADRVRFYKGDIAEFSRKLTADVVFLTPPWTFSEYFDLIQLGCPLEELLEASCKSAPSAVLYLPVNYDPIELCDAIHNNTSFDQAAEFEVYYYKSKPVALVCYLGACVKFPRSDLSNIIASKLGCRPDKHLTERIEGASVRQIVEGLTKTEHEISGRSQQNSEVFTRNLGKVALKSITSVRLYINKGSLETELVRLALRNCKLGHFAEETGTVEELKLGIDGHLITGAHAIVRYLYTRSKMYPKDPIKAYETDSVVDFVRDIISEINEAPSRDEYFEKPVKERLELLEARFTKGYGSERKMLGDLYVEYLVRFYLEGQQLPTNLSNYFSSIFSL